MGYYEGEQQAYAPTTLAALQAKRPTINEAVQMRIDSATREIADLKKIQDILARNPDLEELHNLLAKSNIR